MKTLVVAVLTALTLGITSPVFADSFGGGRGPAGPQGDTGPEGPPGADGTDGAPGAPGLDANRPLNACGIAWTGSGYVFRVAACEYSIAGTTYTAPETEVTLDAADDTFDRIDLIAVNTSGAVVVVDGTASASPVTPEIDPTTQLQIGLVSVPAQSTEPADVTVETIFTEGGAESWTESESGDTINVASSSNCRTGSVCVEGTSVTNNDYFQFVDGDGLFDLSAYDTLVCYLRLKSGWTGSRGLSVEWRSTTTHSSAVLLRNGQLGIDGTNTSTYQQIVIPTSTFAVTPGVQVDRVRFTRVGGNTLGFYVDDCSLQGGVQQTVLGTASMQYRSGWEATSNYLTNQVVTYGGNTYIALQNNTNVTPGTSATTWEAITDPNTQKRSFGVFVGDPAGSALEDTADTPACFINQLGYSITITECCCTVDSTTGDPAVMFQRDDGSAADILSGNLACATAAGSGCTTSFSGSENVIADGQEVDCNVATAGGTATWASMQCAYTVP